MTSIAVAGTLPSQTRSARAGWIVSPAFDATFFLFGAVITLPILFGGLTGNALLATGAGMTLAFAHYMSSYAFYFWDDSYAYHRARWVAFFAGPVVIAGAYTALIVFQVPNIIQFVLFFWNTYHVARQNCGILSIYRHRSAVTEVAQRNAANHAILAVSLFLSVWNISTHREVAALFNKISPTTIDIVRYGTGFVAAVALVQLGLVLSRRLLSGGKIGLPEGAFLFASIAFFHPFLWIPNSEIATFAMLQPHFVQYIALVWLLHRRKFGQSAEGAPSWLRLISGKLVYLGPALFVAGFAFYAFYRIARHWGHPMDFERLYLLIAIEHFYLDGLVWSFRQKHVRTTIAPYLLSAPSA